MTSETKNAKISKTSIYRKTFKLPCITKGTSVFTPYTPTVLAAWLPVSFSPQLEAQLKRVTIVDAQRVLTGEEEERTGLRLFGTASIPRHGSCGRGSNRLGLLHRHHHLRAREALQGVC